MRQKAREIDWDLSINQDINIYANNISNQITQLADSSIPNKIVKNSPQLTPHGLLAMSENTSENEKGPSKRRTKQTIVNIGQLIKGYEMTHFP